MTCFSADRYWDIQFIGPDSGCLVGFRILTSVMLRRKENWENKGKKRFKNLVPLCFCFAHMVS